MVGFLLFIELQLEHIDEYCAAYYGVVDHMTPLRGYA